MVRGAARGAHLNMHCCQYRSMWSQFSTCPWRMGHVTVCELALASASCPIAKSMSSSADPRRALAPAATESLMPMQVGMM